MEERGPGWLDRLPYVPYGSWLKSIQTCPTISLTEIHYASSQIENVAILKPT